MKTLSSTVSIFTFLALQLFSVYAFSQNQHAGIWEGFFMNDFKTVLEIKSDVNNNYTGNIKMFNGSTLIQDDGISKININQHQLTFYIEAKETEFEGKFNNEVSKLTGSFIFPDKSKHNLFLLKSDSPKTSINNFEETYLELNNKKYPVTDLKNDIYFLADQIRRYHPQLYLYCPKSDFDDLVNATVNQINTELTLREYFFLIAPITENIKCSHTGIRLPAEYQKREIENGNFLPLKLIFTADKAYCIRNYDLTNFEIKPGNEILSINTTPIKTIIENIIRFIPTEGNNKTTKIFELNRNFNLFFNMYDNSRTFKIEFTKEGSILTTTLEACKFADIENNSESTQIQAQIDFITDRKNKTGYLTIRSFTFNDVNNYIQELDSIFQMLERNSTENLVVDLRGNSGGHPIFAAQLFSYLTDKEFVYFKRNDDVKEFEPLYNKMQANKHRFSGDIFILVDGGCLSTSGHLISLLKYHTKAIFLGEEPGSTYYCNDFSIKKTLPNTNIEVNIPRTTFRTAILSSKSLDPFNVDYKINCSLTDRLNKHDSYINFVNKIILQL